MRATKLRARRTLSIMSGLRDRNSETSSAPDFRSDDKSRGEHGSHCATLTGLASATKEPNFSTHFEARSTDRQPAPCVPEPDTRAPSERAAAPQHPPASIETLLDRAPAGQSIVLPLLLAP